MKLRHFLIVLGIVAALVGLFLNPPWEKEAPRPQKPEPAKKEPGVVPPKKTELDVDAALEPEDKEEPVPETKEEEPEPEPEPEEDTSDGIARYQKEDDGRRPVNEPDLAGNVSAASWRQPEALQRRLASKIRVQLKDCSQAKVTAVLKDPENRLAITQWEFINRSDPKRLGELMRNSDLRKELTPFLNDLRWLSSFVYDGEMKNAEVALQIMYELRKADPKMDEEILRDGQKSEAGLKRRVAGAIAAEFARQGWYGDGPTLTPEEIREMKQNGMPLLAVGGRRSKDRQDVFHNARERYLYFAESIDKELLNGSFATLPGWLLRFPCGWKGNMAWGSATSMRWERDNCAAPARAYLGMAFQVNYLPTNVFGDSIFTDYYYQPFQPIYNGEHAHLVRDVGGVCGSLSHFGASTACANGVPAFTMGEPGHCAYAVYVDDVWVPSNSVSEKRSPHWGVYGDYTWGALEMMTAMYQDGQLTRDAQMVASMGSMLMNQKQTVRGLSLMELSATMQPLNAEIWNRYVMAATASLRKNIKKWQEVNSFLCSSIAPRFPGRCAALLRERIYPSLLAAVRPPKKKLELFKQYFDFIRQDEKSEWKMEPLFDAQYDSLDRSQPAKLDYFKMAIDTAAQKTDFAAAVTWAICKAHGESKLYAKRVMEMVKEAQAASPRPDLVAAAVVRAGELLGDYEMAHLNDGKYPVEEVKMPDFGKPTGNLISDKAKIVLSEYPREMATMLQHSDALTPKGGLIASASGKHQTITVEFDKPATIGTIVIVPQTNGKDYRAWQLSVFDGKQWKPYMSLPDAQDKDHFKITFERQAPRAKAIRIDSGENQSIGINFKALLIYDNKKS